MPLSSSDLNAASIGDAWDRMAGAETAEQLCVSWLQVLCNRVLPAQAGLVLLRQDDGSFAPVAAVPANRDLSHLAEIATEALRTRDSVMRHDAKGLALLAYPLQTDDQLRGSVVVELGLADQASLERCLQLTHWGAGWLVDMLHQGSAVKHRSRSRQGSFLVDVLLALLSGQDARESDLALVNRIAGEFGCHQVQLGLAQGKTLRVQAVSHAAWFDHRAGIVNLATQAMHEAFDQRQRIDWPPAEGQGTQVSAAHARYADKAGAKALCSLPLVSQTRVCGVLLLERDRPFTAQEHDFLDTLALGLAPAIDLQQEAAQGAARRLARTGRRWLGRVTDSSHPAIKLGAGIALVALLLLAVVPAPFHISAQALVEGAVQRSAVVPFDGFLREAPARAGDKVRAGQMLAMLDDKDLQLEKARGESELEVALRKERQAMAKGNRVDQRLAAAQANQAKAQLDLALSKLQRLVIAAPFDAIVVKGDLSQQLGSPVEMGKVLFELAPLDGWRVILKVDERDIGEVRVGAPGELVLASLPGSRWPFAVKKLTPISVPENGRNHFRVEAELVGQPPALRPNMEGIGKIDAGRHSLLWSWTRPLTHWVRLEWWRLMP